MFANPKKYNHRRKKTVTLISKAPKHTIGIIHDHTTETFLRNHHHNNGDEGDDGDLLSDEDMYHSDSELQLFMDDDEL